MARGDRYDAILQPTVILSPPGEEPALDSDRGIPQANDRHFAETERHTCTWEILRRLRMTQGGKDDATLHTNVILNEVKNLFTPSTQAKEHRHAPRQEIFRSQARSR
ncbi:MAG: hypothetical protein GVY15_11030 [Bacteroidetes bacterium]|jgi:hypothetical protein|nr:hypothetical protein [Bacteroidota bacterium]